MIRIAKSIGRSAGGRKATQDVLLHRAKSTNNFGGGKSSDGSAAASSATILGRRRRLPSNLLLASRSNCTSVATKRSDNSRLVGTSAGTSTGCRFLSSSGDAAAGLSVLPPREDTATSSSTAESDVCTEETTATSTASTLPLLPVVEDEATTSWGESSNKGSHESTPTAPSILPLANSLPNNESAADLNTTRSKGRPKPLIILFPNNLSEGQLSQPPSQILHNQYRAVLKMFNADFDSCYTLTKMDLGGKTMYHATLKCPYTGCLFHSATPYGQKDFAGLKGSAADCITLTAQMNGTAESRIFYGSKRNAQHAAAARALDCISLQEFRKFRDDEDAVVGEGDTFRLCAEEPYVPTAHSVLAADDGPPAVSSDNLYFLSPKGITYTSPRKFLFDNMTRFHPEIKSLPLCEAERFLEDTTGESDEGKRTFLTWWTATYNDPLSGQVFEAGTMLDDGGLPFESKIFNGKIYYKTKKLAIHAATARAIDCLSLREFQKQRGDDKVPTDQDAFRLCVEEPFTDFDYCSYEDRCGKVEEEADEKDDYFMSAKGHFAFRYLYTSAKDFLAKNYSRYQTSLVWEDALFVHTIVPSDEGEQCWFTAKFKCPISGEEFVCGTLRNSNPSNVRIVGEDVCYNTKKLAEQAACARAVDSLSFREFVKRREEGVDVDEDNIMRLCDEDPYLEKVDQPQNASSLPSPTSTPQRITLPSSLIESLGDASVGPEDSSEALTSSSNVPMGDEWGQELEVQGLDYDSLNDADDVDDDYVVQLLLGTSVVHDDAEESSTTATSTTLATAMERIIEAWVQSPSTLSSSTKVTTPSISQLIPPRNKASTMESVAKALAWFDRLEYGIDVSDNDDLAEKTSKFQPKLTVGTLCKTPVSVAACNTILHALADANSTLSFYEQGEFDLLADDTDTVFRKLSIEEGVGYIESLANHILDRMLQNAYGGPSTDIIAARSPNTETFNALIGCLCRRTPAETAAAAEALLNKMLNEQRGATPPPNADTFNAVIDLWAAVPGHAGREKVEELFLTMTAESHRSEGGNDLRPNRDTFLSALFGLTQPELWGTRNGEAYFAEDDAKKWVERMKVVAADYGDDGLLPDTEVYNAPLRWSGSRCRNAADWDNYSAIFKDGFVDGNNNAASAAAHNSDAEAMERWFLDMEEMSKDNPKIFPSTETFESIIQAWVRTGSYQGVLRAEQWAQRAIEAASRGMTDDIEKQICPRLQTFHPIIAAWAHCGYPERVQQWTDTLDELSGGTMRELKPDGRMKAAQIVAWRRRQRLYYSAESDPSDPPMTAQAKLDASLDAAKSCMECFDGLCSQVQGQVKSESDPFTIFDASSVGQVVDAWGEAARLAASCAEEVESDASTTSTAFALSEMFRAIALVDGVIDLYRSTPMSGLNNETAENYQYHMNHLMARSPKLYAKAIEHIHTLDNMQTVDKETLSPSLFSSFLPNVEKLLRRCEFYNIALIPKGPSARKERRAFRAANELLTYSDSFSYDTDGQEEECPATLHPHHKLFANILGCCESLAGSNQYGDAVRLVMLIQKQIFVSSKGEEEINMSKLSEQVFDLVDGLVKDESEKAALLQIMEQGIQYEDRSEEETVPNSNFLPDDAAAKIEHEATATAAATTKPKRRVVIKRRTPTKKAGRRVARAGGPGKRR